MPVMHQAALDMLKLFVKWQFWGCKFRRQICQLCVTSPKTANVNSDLRISLPQCIVLQGYERKLRKHDYYSLFLCAEGADHSR